MMNPSLNQAVTKEFDATYRMVINFRPCSRFDSVKMIETLAGYQHDGTEFNFSDSLSVMPRSRINQSWSNSWVVKLTLGLLVALTLLTGLEFGLRAVDFRHERRLKVLWNPKITGFIGTIQFFLDTFHSPPGYLWITQPNSPYTDRFGFRLPELAFDKTPDKFRVAFLGGSTTQGGYRPYPERTIRILNDAIGSNRYEALNVACSSYSLHQSLKALERWVLPRKPDIVFVYHGWNDIVIARDGFSDREKDHTIGTQKLSRFKLPTACSELRLTGLLAKIYEKTDHTWPRQRVSFTDFSAGLHAIAETCARQNIRMMIMARPSQREDKLTLPPYAPGSIEEQHMLNEYGTVDPVNIYKLQADRIIQIQRSVAAAYDHVDLCDGDAIVAQLTARESRGEFGDSVHIFREDDCHLFELGEELLAQQVAMAIAPEQTVAISNRINSTDYLMDMAVEFYNEEAPRESYWFLQQIISRTTDPVQLADLQAHAGKAMEKFAFADKFRAGRSGGSIDDYETKLRLLKECLVERPFDYGVMLQIYFVCFAMSHGEDAAEAMSDFSPMRPDHVRDWLFFTLESHVTGRRLPEAQSTAKQLLQIEPQNPLARTILAHGLKKDEL